MKKVTHQLNVRRVKNLSRPGELNLSEALEPLNEDLVIHAVEDFLEDLMAWVVLLPHLRAADGLFNSNN